MLLSMPTAISSITLTLEGANEHVADSNTLWISLLSSKMELFSAGRSNFSKWDTVKLEVGIGTESHNINFFGLNFCFLILKFYFGMKIAITLSYPLEPKLKMDYFVFKNCIIKD